MKHKQSVFEKLLIINLFILVASAAAFAQKGKNETHFGAEISKPKKSEKTISPQNFRDTGIDETFVPELGQYDRVSAADLQKDGKIIIGGEFFNGNANYNVSIIRLNPDGSLDKTFSCDAGFPLFNLSKIKVQPDGKVLVAVMGNLFRLNSDGTRDQSFLLQYFAGSGNYSIQDIQLYDDGKILVSGYFLSVGGAVNYNIARLNADGTLDTTFQKTWGVLSYTRKSAIAPDGKIYAAIENNSYWFEYGLFTRLNSDGSLDPTFQWSRPATGSYQFFEYSEFYDVIVENNGSILMSGRITNYNRLWKNELNGIYRMDQDGNLLNEFEDTEGRYNQIYPQNDGKIITLSKNFQQYRNLSLKRYFYDGRIDPTFSHFIQLSQLRGYEYFPLFSGVLTQPDGKILVYGELESVNGIPKKGIVRLNTAN